MAKNLELKVKISSFNDIKARLGKTRITQETTLNQKDIYYKWDKGLLKLRVENEEYHLIKYHRDESKEKRFSKTRKGHLNSCPFNVNPQTHYMGESHMYHKVKN